ncbi:hypothetical protein [Dactylosporangium sp. NPDC051541]|uniref:hypothetical protein n=1 Tax=Dactylosporangium sp. NPDC051541 TaxID=3363977 RepID=UPI00379922FE
MGVRGPLARLAGLTATIALFWVLHEQFEGRSAAGPALVLGGALLTWWLLRSAFTGVGWRVRLGRLATGLILSGGAVYYGRAPLRLDVVLLALAVAMLAARAVWYGKVPWRALIAPWLALAIAGRYVGQALALTVFWVPDRLIGLTDGALAVLVGVVVWPLWAAVLAFTLGVYQSYTLVRERVTHSVSTSWGYGPTTHTDTTEDWQEQVLQGPPPPTHLRPLTTLGYTNGGWHTSSSGGGSYRSMSTTSWSTGRWHHRGLQFPPAYIPVWATWLKSTIRRKRAAE